MSGRDPFQPRAETRCASRDSKRVAFSLHVPSQNHLLAALPLQDFERLLPELEPIPLPLGWTIHRGGDREKHLYFPTAGVVSDLYVTKGGVLTEFAVTGREGVIGVASFLGGESMPSQEVVLDAGYAYRLPADLARNEVAHDSALAHLLLRYTQALIAQIGQIAACNRHHSLEQQLCRWILSRLDRLPLSELTITQAQIADMLGVRRSSITMAAGKLKRAGLIHYNRGHLVVLDRTLLEAEVCECYASIKREYVRLLSLKAPLAAPCTPHVTRTDRLVKAPYSLNWPDAIESRVGAASAR